MAGDHFRDEHTRIKGDNDPENPPVSGRGTVKAGATIRAARIHDGLTGTVLSEPSVHPTIYNDCRNKGKTMANLQPIGALAKSSGCSVQTIRWYEQSGLLPPPQRTDGGRR